MNRRSGLINIASTATPLPLILSPEKRYLTATNNLLADKYGPEAAI